LIAITPQMRVLVSIEPADFRRGIDGLARLCREALGEEPFSGTVYVFRNRRATAIKLLVYDGQGFWLCHKRLSQGRFGYWPAPGSRGRAELEAHALQVLVFGGDPGAASGAPFWRRVGPQAA
jgi:transposase